MTQKRRKFCNQRKIHSSVCTCNNIVFFIIIVIIFITASTIVGVEQTTQLDDNNDAILQILDELSDDGHPHDREHDQEHVLNPDGKIFDDIVTGTTMVHPTGYTIFTDLQIPQCSIICSTVHLLIVKASPLL